jgi:hypothetical protein
MQNLLKLLMLFILTISLIVPLTALAGADPHCTDGNCSEYVQECWDQGNEVLCLNALTDHAVTLCINYLASVKLMQHHPQVCRGTCDSVGVCNFDLLAQ